MNRGHTRSREGAEFKWTEGIPARGGFTIIELVGVMVIIAILATIVATSVIHRVDEAAAKRETADLNTIADAYVRSALRNKLIAGTNTWANAVSAELSAPVAKITTTPRGFTRAFLVDPTLSIGGSSLPYAQNSAGTNRPTSARVMFVSSLARSQLPIATSVPSAAEFDAIWNAPEGSKPATARWNGWASGDDLRIKRVNLEPLFYQLILIDRDPDGPAIFSIDGSSPLTVPTGGRGWESYYLDGTIASLHNTNSTVIARHLLKQNISFVFERNAWRGQVSGRLYGNKASSDFEREAEEFFDAAWNPRSGQGSSQISVLVAMYTFMFDYTLWANECPRFAHHGYTIGNVTSLPEYDLLNAVGQDNGFLDKYSDDNTGLLKPR